MSSELPSLIDGVFPWVTSAGLAASWPSGVVVLVAGLGGALITTYLTDPAFLPELGGTSELRRSKQRLDEARDTWREELLRRRTLSSSDATALQASASLCEQLEKQCSHWQGTYQAQRSSILRRGLPLFVLLGGLFACLLASSVLEAVAIGVAWPASLRGLGLQKRNEEVKDEAATIAESTGADLSATERQLEQTERQLREARLNEKLTILTMLEVIKRGRGNAGPTA